MAARCSVFATPDEIDPVDSHVVVRIDNRLTPPRCVTRVSQSKSIMMREQVPNRPLQQGMVDRLQLLQ